MPTLRNTGEIIDALGGRIDYARNELARKSKEKLQTLTNEWYDSYTPKRYRRTNKFRNSIRTVTPRNTTAKGFYTFQVYYDWTVHNREIRGEKIVNWINRTGGYGSEDNANMVFKGRNGGGQYSAAFIHNRPKHMIERTAEWLGEQVGRPADMQRWLSGGGNKVTMRIRRK